MEQFQIVKMIKSVNGKAGNSVRLYEVSGGKYLVQVSKDSFGVTHSSGTIGDYTQASNLFDSFIKDLVN